LQKTDNLKIKIVNIKNEILGMTYPKRAKGLVKNGRAYYIDNETICIKEEYNMEKRKFLGRIKIPNYSLSEELISSISHGFGAALSIAMLVLCVVFASIHHDPYAVVSSAIYGGTSVILYTMSTLYHSFKVNNAKRLFRIIDHCSVFLLIAGTYTPYALVTLREANVALGWTVFGVIWLAAIIGIVLTVLDMNKYRKLGLILYLVMGWMIIFTYNTLASNLAKTGLVYLILGGVIYTLGALLYVIGKKVKYMHSIFHFFVVGASIMFFFSIFFYVI